MRLGKQDGSYAMELAALISLLCIAGIFFFSHLARQADALDLQAENAARQLQPAIEKFFAENPGGKLTLPALSALGVDIPQAVKLEIPPGRDAAENWQVALWHPEGQKRFVVSAKGVAAKPL